MLSIHQHSGVSMTRPFIAALALSIAATACGSSASGCNGIADEFVDEIQAMLDAMSDLSVDDLADGPPAELAAIEERLDDLDRRGGELGCEEDAEAEAYFRSRLEDLEADGPFAELLLEDMKGEFGGQYPGVFGWRRPSRAQLPSRSMMN